MPAVGLDSPQDAHTSKQDIESPTLSVRAVKTLPVRVRRLPPSPGCGDLLGARPALPRSPEPTRDPPVLPQAGCSPQPLPSAPSPPTASQHRLHRSGDLAPAPLLWLQKPPVKVRGEGEAPCPDEVGPSCQGATRIPSHGSTMCRGERTVGRGAKLCPVP